MEIESLFDQIAEMIVAADRHPSLIPGAAKVLRRFHQELVATGFTDDQAVTVLTAFAKSKTGG